MLLDALFVEYKPDPIARLFLPKITFIFPRFKFASPLT
nr:MAG TPA: hypothetical protein [Caudoviricetes sp.]